MSIQKVIRTISEKTTSVEHPIEVTQKGTIAVGLKYAGLATAIPTNIKNPKLLKITALNHAARRGIDGAACYCDMELKPAASFASIFAGTAGSLASGGIEILTINNGKGYLSSRSTVASGTWLASDSLVASDSYFTRIPWIASNESKFLRVELFQTATAASMEGWKYAKFNYEVTGY